MKKNNNCIKLPVYLWLVFTVWCTACQYEPDAVYHRDLGTPEENPSILIDLNSILPEDTIYIKEITRVTCNINCGSRDIHFVDVLMDGKIMEQITGIKDTHPIQFYIYPELLTDKHILTVEYSLNSGTKSIADVLGYEDRNFEALWNVRLLRGCD